MKYQNKSNNNADLLNTSISLKIESLNGLDFHQLMS